MVAALLGLGHRVTVEALGARRCAAAKSALDARPFRRGTARLLHGPYAEAQGISGREPGDRPRTRRQDKRGRSCFSRWAWRRWGKATWPPRGAIWKKRSLLARELGNKRDIAARSTRWRSSPGGRRLSTLPSRCTRSVVALARELGDRESIAIGLLNLAMVSIGRGSADRARETVDRGARHSRGNRVEIDRAERAGSLRRACRHCGQNRRRWPRIFSVRPRRRRRRPGFIATRRTRRFSPRWWRRSRAALDEATFAASEAAGRALSYPEAMTRRAPALSGAA